MGPPGCCGTVCSPAVLYLPVLQFLQSFSPVVPVQQSVVLLVLGPVHLFYQPILSSPKSWHLPSPASQRSNIAVYSRHPPGPPKCDPRRPKSRQNEVPGRPEDPKISKKSKICDFKKTSVFTMFSTHLTIIFRSIFTPKSLKKQPTTSGRRFSPQNHENIQTYLKNKVRGGHQNSPKTSKNRDLDTQGSSVEPPGLPRSAKWCSRVPKGA